MQCSPPHVAQYMLCCLTSLIGNSTRNLCSQATPQPVQLMYVVSLCGVTPAGRQAFSVQQVHGLMLCTCDVDSTSLTSGLLRIHNACLDCSTAQCHVAQLHQHLVSCCCPGSAQNASEPVAVSAESAENATGTTQPESLSDSQKQHQAGQQPPQPSQQQRQTEEEQPPLQQLHQQRSQQQRQAEQEQLPLQQSQQQQSQQQRQEEEEETDSTEEDRHNFALSKDGAKIVACNREAKKCSAILDTDSDTFMKNDCKADKWFIVELSQVRCTQGCLDRHRTPVFVVIRP